MGYWGGSRTRRSSKKRFELVRWPGPDLFDLPPPGLPLEGGQRQPTDRPRAVESNTSNENQW